jgi:WD40 repeat protein
MILPKENPFHLHLLEGHTEPVRAIAAHGRFCVSGSYDHTVRVWDLVNGTCLHVLKGHAAKGASVKATLAQHAFPYEQLSFSQSTAWPSTQSAADVFQAMPTA